MADKHAGLVDRFGRPIQREMLTQPIARATLTGVRSAVGEGATRGLTPVRLAHILREALNNDPERYCELAEEMEEKDLHYLSVLETRKRQVSQLDQIVTAASKDKADEDIAAAVREDFVDNGLIDRCLFDLLDAVGKGFSLLENHWDTKPDRWRITELEYVDPRFVRFDRETMRTPLLLSDQGQHLPLEPFKFVFVKLSAKSGIPIRGGIARVAAWAYLFKNFGIKDWVQFCEVYGLPLRLGKYPPGASEDDKDALLAAIRAIASDAAGIIPQNMTIEFVETASKASSAELYKLLLEYLDDQVSKAVLGQTGTTDATPGQLGSGDQHTQVREDIERSDAKAVSAAINQQAIRPYVDLNFGPQKRYPWFKIGRPETKNAQLMIDAVQKLGPMGFRVAQYDIREAVGFNEPEDDDECFAAPAPAVAPPIGADGRPLDSNALTAARLAQESAASDAIDDAADAAASDWQQVMMVPVEQLAALFAQSTSFEDMKARLSALYTEIDMKALGEKLANMTFQSTLNGYAQNTVKR